MTNKILLVTGRLAEPIVREASKKIPQTYDYDIYVLPIDVAALINSKLLNKHLATLENLMEYDYIMVSGAIQDSMEELSRKLGLKIVKGPRHAADIPYILSQCKLDELSPDIPADEIVKDKQTEYVKTILEKAEENVLKERNLKVGDVYIPCNPPPIRIISEITEAHKLSDEEILRIIEKRIESGADIISIGFEAGNPRPNEVRRVIKFVKEMFDIPVAIDSLIPSEIKAGLDAGADMVMSLEGGNIDRVYDLVRDVPSVVIPYNSIDGIYPKTCGEKLRYLRAYLDKALKYGIKHLIADPILEPIDTYRGGFINSLLAYIEVKKLYPDIPLLMGIGNVSELFDVDSVGVNAFLTHLACEIRASIILVVEKSVKCTGSTYEASTASKMATLSYARKSPPKDLGINLLILKDKVRVNVPRPHGEFKQVDAFNFKRKHELDKLGIFSIRVNHRDKCIEAYYIGRKGRVVIQGRNAREIRDKILDLGLVSSLSHAFYLGIELEKAEIALRLGKNYVQEEEVFKSSIF